MTWVVGPVELDGLVEVLAQYDTEVRWNGWLCPQLDALSVVRVLDTLSAENPNEPPLAYEFRKGVLHVLDLCAGDNSADSIDVYEPDEDGVYALGSHAWVWSAVRDPNRAARHRTVVPVMLEIVCMYAKTGDGGQTTTVGEGYDYCQNHGWPRMGGSLPVPW